MNLSALNRSNNLLICQRFLLFFFPFSLGLGAVILILYGMEMTADRRLVELNENQNLEIQKQSITSDLQTVRANLKTLIEQNELKDLLEDLEDRKNTSLVEITRQAISSEYLTLAKQFQLFDQILFIDTNGQEIVRVNFNYGQPQIVQQTSLQNQSSRYWFQDSIKLRRGEIFISPLELNIDHGKLTVPFKPMIRLATPVFDRQGQKRGVIVLNYLGQKILDNLQKSSTAVGQMLLVNHQGYWLKGLTPEEEWGFMIPERGDRTFAKEFPQAWPQIKNNQSGHFFTQKGLFIFETLAPQRIIQPKSKISASSLEAPITTPSTLSTSSTSSAVDDQWKIISFIPSSVLDQRLAPARNRAIFLFLSLLGLGGIGAYLIALAQVQQRTTELELRRSESWYQKLAANIPCMIYKFTLRPDGWSGFTYVSQGCQEIYGLEPAEVVAQSAVMMVRIHPHDMPSLQKAIATSAQTLENFIWNGRIINPTETKWVRAISHPEPQTNGDIIWDGILIDITEIKLTELALRDLKAQLETKVSEKTKELKQSESTLRQKAIDLEIALQQIQITQAQLVQNGKMSGLGQLVAGVAHEINNPVNFIYGNLIHADRYTEEILELLSLYQKCSAPPTKLIKEFEHEIDIDFIKDDLPKLLTSMKVGADRIQKIVLSLRNFSRMDESDLKEFDVHEGIDSTIMILQSQLKAKGDHPEIVIKKNYDRLPLVECYAGQLNQVFMNILSNAIDALEESYPMTKRRLHITITTRRIDYYRVEIKIADNGTGIPESVKAKLFDPFFTTKEVDKGTGLGLAISYQIVVDKHNGELSFASVLGEGTEFIITIPVRQSFTSDQISA